MKWGGGPKKGWHPSWSFYGVVYLARKVERKSDPVMDGAYIWVSHCWLTISVAPGCILQKTLAAQKEIITNVWDSK